MTPEHEGLVLRGGLVIDGTGRAPFRADVAVAGGRIAALLSPGAPADGRAIDVEGRVVAPGFVDGRGRIRYR